MGLTISAEILDIIGIIFSAVGVTLAFFQAFVKKAHSRALDCIQWGYILAIANASVSIPFSNKLYVGSSLIVLPSDSLTGFYCPMGTYVCLRGFALSFLVIFVGCLLIMRFITIPQKVREKGVTFPRVFRMFKGLFKWFYLPLIYLSLYNLITDTSGTISIPAIVVLAVLVIFPIVQVILYKYFDEETEDPFLKWLQLANYAKAALFALLVVLAVQYATTSFYYYAAFLLVAYAAFFALKFPFKYEVAGRVLYLIGEVIFYFLYSLYVSGSAWLATYYIDLFAIGIILLIDITDLIMEAVAACKQWRAQGGEVVPEESGPTKKNRYEVEDIEGELNKNHSRDNLNDSRASSTHILGNSSNIKPNNNKNNGRPRPGK